VVFLFEGFGEVFELTAFLAGLVVRDLFWQLLE